MKSRLLKTIVAFSVFTAFLVGWLIYTAVDDAQTSSPQPLKEHLDLFTSSAQHRISTLCTTSSKNRETTSSLVFDHTADLFVLKVLLRKDLPLKNIVKFYNESSSWSFAIYSKFASYKSDAKIKAGKSRFASTVNFKCSGDVIRNMIFTDDLSCYYVNFKDFSINYDGGPNDILVQADSGNVPMSIAFVKKRKSLYIIIMTVRRGVLKMNPNSLINIINRA